MAKRVKLDSPQLLRLMLYGVPGSTKTRTSASAALDDRTYPTLMIESSGNPVSFRDYIRKPDVVTLEKLSDLDPLYDWLARGQPASHTVTKELGLTPGYKSVVLDTLTDIQRLSFDLTTGNADKGPGTLRAQAQIQHHQATLGQMATCTRLFYSLPLHVIMTAQEKEDKDNATGTLHHRPMFTGQAADILPSFAYTVARLVNRGRARAVLSGVDYKDDKIVSVALFIPFGNMISKDQTGAFPNYIVNPTITKLLDYLNSNTNQ